jgi:hypothetical protein
LSCVQITTVMQALQVKGRLVEVGAQIKRPRLPS